MVVSAVHADWRQEVRRLGNVATNPHASWPDNKKAARNLVKLALLFMDAARAASRDAEKAKAKLRKVLG